MTDQVTSPAPARTYHAGHESRKYVCYCSGLHFSGRTNLLAVTPPPPCTMCHQNALHRSTGEHRTTTRTNSRASVLLKTFPTHRKPVAASLTTTSGYKSSRHLPSTRHDHMSAVNASRSQLCSTLHRIHFIPPISCNETPYICIILKPYGDLLHNL